MSKKIKKEKIKKENNLKSNIKKNITKKEIKTNSNQNNNSKRINKENRFDIINYKKNYKLLMIIPVIIFIFSIFSIINTNNQEGTPIYRDISLKGGLSATISINTEITTVNFENKLKEKFPTKSFKISEITEKGIKSGFIVDTNLEEEKLVKFIEEIFKKKFISGENYMSNYISPTLSNSFFKQAAYILLISFGLMSLVVFLYFRELVPSGAIVLSGIFDIIVTVGILNFYKIEISIAGIGSLLMLIGYSIDTDILLTNRVVKEEGENYFDKAHFAFKTGILMTLTTLVAGIAALFLTNSSVIHEISLILVIGLMVDFISTWLQNTGILLWWLNSKNKN